MSGDLSKLIDRGFVVVVFRNQLGSVTSFAVYNGHEDIENAKQDADEGGALTDDFSVEAAIKRLSDKIMCVGDYAGRREA